MAIGWESEGDSLPKSATLSEKPPLEVLLHKGVRFVSEKVVVMVFRVVLLGTLLLVAATGQSQREKESTLDYFKKFDKDGDLHLDLSEFRKSGGEGDGEAGAESEAWFKRHDVDKDGLLSMGELASSLFGGVEVNALEDQEYLSNYGGMPEELMEGGQPTWEEEEMEDGVRYDVFSVVRDGTVEELKDVLGRVSSPDMQMNDGDCTPLHMALDMWDGWNMHSHMQ